MTPLGKRDAILIHATPQPRTVESLAANLVTLGLKPGMICLVHCSLSSIGWINGGPVALVRALQQVLSSEGTLVMPTHTSDLSDPENWEDPPLPREWWQAVRDSMPAYDPRTTPTRYMSRVAELFRTLPGVHRSEHPRHSFAAWGKNAQEITYRHSLWFSMGETSPLGTMYNLDTRVLMIGVGFGSNTSFHLAEYKCGKNKHVVEKAKVLKAGEEVWAKYQDIEFDVDQFPDIGAAFMATGAVREAPVGSAPTRFFSQRDAVDFAVSWLRSR